MRALLTAASLGFVVCLAAPAAAGPDAKPRRAALAKSFDFDGNGKLSKTERAALKKARAARRAKRIDRMFERLDTNDDGVISKTEFERGMKKRRRRRF